MFHIKVCIFHHMICQNIRADQYTHQRPMAYGSMTIHRQTTLPVDVLTHSMTQTPDVCSNHDIGYISPLLHIIAIWICDTVYRTPSLTFNLLIMIVKPLQTAWNLTRRRVTRRLVWFQAVCHSANMPSKF